MNNVSSDSKEFLGTAVFSVWLSPETLLTYLNIPTDAIFQHEHFGLETHNVCKISHLFEVNKTTSRTFHVMN